MHTQDCHALPMPLESRDEHGMGTCNASFRQAGRQPPAPLQLALSFKDVQLPNWSLRICFLPADQEQRDSSLYCPACGVKAVLEKLQVPQDSLHHLPCATDSLCSPKPQPGEEEEVEEEGAETSDPLSSLLVGTDHTNTRGSAVAISGGRNLLFALQSPGQHRASRCTRSDPCVEHVEFLQLPAAVLPLLCPSTETQHPQHQEEKPGLADTHPELLQKDLINEMRY
ncbi:hypothetical protein EK904_010581 [Melospiza melodia maxima]|nr:hypothetical protein EK904_010581 [Melospiza melodia maxima]